MTQLPANRTVRASISSKDFNLSRATFSPGASSGGWKLGIRGLLCTALALAGGTAAATAQSTLPRLQPRITAPIDNAMRIPLAGSQAPRALNATDAGALPPATPLTGITLAFARTPAQESSLESLIAAQQNPASALFHQWLTPTQFGARFGVADADIAAVQLWLQQQGFTLGEVANSRDRITFSGTAAQVEAAFGAALHSFTGDGATHFGPVADLTLPAAFGSTILGISNLSDFRPHSQVQRVAHPEFTSSSSGNHFLTPGDVATIYDMKPAASAGYTGAGQSIVVIGQSAIVPSDITTFQTAVGVVNKLPTQVLVPSTGTSAISTGDEGESDLDLEYTSTIATGATIYFVYTGNSTNNGGAFTSLQYAVNGNLAPIISSSYSTCESELNTTSYIQLQAILAQAATQGQTVISASGDDGSTGCAGFTLSTAMQQALAVGYPASSQYVTGLGGTEFPSADVIAGNNTYWTAQGSTDTVSSALSYIPEMVWNDDAANAAAGSSSPLSSGGGGVSVFTPRPSWQAGVPGIPAGAYRLIPDVSLSSSPNNAGYAYCSSDTTAWASGQVSSCTSGLRDATSRDLTVAGGTSFAAPIFAGMLAIINQARGYTTGQGVINPTLYTLASNSITYATAFHDITSGSNACLAGTAYCSTSGASAYAAGTGYDEASGLGSVDFYNLLTAWPKAVTSSLAASVTTLVATSVSPAAGAADVITITVTPALGSTTVPTGTVSVSVDGTVVNSALALTNGGASYTFASNVTGSHVVTVAYSGDVHYAVSTGSIAIVVGATSFTVSATSIAVTAGSSGVSTVTVTPSNAYTGTVAWTLATTSATVNLSNVCYKISSLPVTGVPASTTLTIYTSSSACAALAQQGGAGVSRIVGPRVSSLDPAPVPSPLRRTPFGLALAGLVVALGFGRRSRSLRSRLARATMSLAVLTLLAFGAGSLTGCSSSAAATNVNAATGTYALTLTGTDTISTSLTSKANFTLTIQ